LKKLEILICCDPKRERCCRKDAAASATKCLAAFLESQAPSNCEWKLKPTGCLGQCDKGPVAYVKGKKFWIKNISPEKLEKKKSKLLKKLGF
jgi:(2Fe-2S) ferredoxin